MARKRILLFPGILAVTRIDPNRIQVLLSQSFDSARVPGQLGGRSVQVGQAEASRVQPSASGFINKVKSLYDRDIRQQRAEEGVTRGVKNVDKSLVKLLDAMNPAKGDINLAKIQRHLEALPSSTRSATSRGVDYNELIEARLKQHIGKLGNDELYELFKVNQSSLSHLTQKSERLESSLLSSGREQKIVNFDKNQLERLDAIFSKERDEREKHKEAGFSDDQMVNFRRAGGTPEEVSTFKEVGFSIDQMVSFRRAGGKSEDIKAFKQEGFGVDQMVLYAGFAVTEAKSLKSEYQRLDIPVNEKTLVRDFKASNLKESMTKLGSGVANEVYKGVYQMPDGSSYTGVFKEESKFAKNYFKAMPASGISLANQNAGRRNIASHALNDLLGFDVVTRAEFGMNNDKKLGIVMELAHGQPGKQAKQEVFDDPVIRRELTKLQWLDSLAAQVDRHPENYLIETHADGRGKRVIGIDNDMSFGKKITDPNDISKSHDSNFNGLEMPPIIDTKMAEAFMKLTPENLEASLSGLLDDKEIDAAKKRLTGIQKHIDGLSKAGCVISPDQWGSEKVGELLSDKTKSYVARDRHYVELFKPKATVNIQQS
mgnify:CR=1 FL=1